MSSWIPNAINYQINLRSLAAREPRNAIEAATEQDLPSSPIAYLIRNLEVLKQLGVTVLHLMPPFPMGKEARKGIGSPYAIRDYLEIDKEFGTLTEMRALVRAAHIQGLRIVLGMVPNHTSRDHVWIKEHPQYYVNDEQGTPSFDLDWSDTAKLDYTHPGLRKAMIEAYDFWLQIEGEDDDKVIQGVDGFRIDMAHFINDQGFWDEALAELKRRHPKREILFMAECYGRDNNLALFERGFNAAYDDDLYKVMQYYYGIDATGQTCLLESAEAMTNRDFAATHLAYGDRGLAGAVEHVLSAYEQALPKGEKSPRLARYTDNHDEGRGVYRFGDGGVLAMTQLFFLLGRTIPFLLTGQEFGAMNRPSIHTRFGICDKGRRILTDTEVREEPGIEFEGNLFARDRRHRLGWYAFYQDIIALRLQNPELVHGDFRLLEAGEKCPQNQRTVVAFERKHHDSIIRCAVNLGPETRTLAHASLFQHPPLYGAMADGRLAPFTSVVVRST